MSGSDMAQWGDAAMYESQPISGQKEGARITPRVFLLNATPDPLGTIAADMRMYRGDPVYSLDEISDLQRIWAWDELMKTRLNTPLEGVNLKFMIEAVSRSFTHQLVRQRVGAYYVQESLRFAVKRGLAAEAALPPTIVSGTSTGNIFEDVLEKIEVAYNQLVDAGIPAEDARAILPHCVTTRVIYHTNLRALFDHAGNRLCTQAQFEWRSVFMEIMKAVSNHHTLWEYDYWQWQKIGAWSPQTFAPICYKTGKCEFMSSLDRGCSIRDRVTKYAHSGIASDQWAKGVSELFIDPIKPDEWMANPLAGITTEDNRPT